MAGQDKQWQRHAAVAEIRCAAMALSAISIFVGSFWLAGLLF